MSVRRTMQAKHGVFLSIVVIGAAGCAAIVGADDYTVDKTSTGSGGTTGTSSGTGGATGGVGGVGGVSPPTGGAAGKGGAGGGVPDAGRDGPVPMGAGETICTGNTCPSGQSCLMTAFSPPGLCTYSCDTTPCDAAHECVQSKRPEDNFPSSCVKKCPTGVTCPSGLLCVPISTGPVCLPTGWFDGLGIGDDCFADVQCLSGTCTNKPGGWCTKACGAADPLCAHDTTTFENRNSELNWCVTNAGSLSCVPGCDEFGATTCALYPGTSCKAVTDVLGTAQLACLP